MMNKIAPKAALGTLRRQCQDWVFAPRLISACTLLGASLLGCAAPLGTPEDPEVEETGWQPLPFGQSPMPTEVLEFLPPDVATSVAGQTTGEPGLVDMAPVAEPRDVSTTTLVAGEDCEDNGRRLKTAVEASRGDGIRAIRVPAGRYCVPSAVEVPSSTLVVGDISGGTYVTSATGTVFEVSGATRVSLAAMQIVAREVAIEVESSAMVRLSHLRLRGGERGVILRKRTERTNRYILVSDTFVSGATVAGVEIEGAVDSVFVRNRVEDSGRGFKLHSGPFFGNRIASNYLLNNAGDGILGSWSMDEAACHTFAEAPQNAWRGNVAVGNGGFAFKLTLDRAPNCALGSVAEASYNVSLDNGVDRFLTRGLVSSEAETDAIDARDIYCRDDGRTSPRAASARLLEGVQSLMAIDALHREDTDRDGVENLLEVLYRGSDYLTADARGDALDYEVCGEGTSRTMATTLPNATALGQ